MKVDAKKEITEVVININEQEARSLMKLFGEMSWNESSKQFRSDAKYNDVGSSYGDLYFALYDALEGKE